MKINLFAQPTPPQVFENLTLENGKALCSSHQEDLNSVYLNNKLFGSSDNIAACSKCTRPTNSNTNQLATFRAYSGNKCCVVSPNLSQRPLAQTVKDPCLDPGNQVLEHVLWDTESYGYELKSLVYMKDQKVLAACSKNGSVCFWSIGDSIELIEPKLNLEKKINFAKYCVISNGKKHLAIGTDKGVHVYNMAEEGSYIRLIGVIDEEKMISDLDFLKNEGKLVTVYSEGIAKIWNIETLEMEKAIDLQQYNIKGKIHTVMYMERTGELAIEHEKGLSAIKFWQQTEGHARHHFAVQKEGFGCKYLQTSERFILNNGSYIDVLEGETFKEVRRYEMPQSIFARDTTPTKFIASQDESVFLSNYRSSQLNFYKEQLFSRHSISHFIWGVSDFELMEDQYRIAVANQFKGTISILRVNTNVIIERNEGLSPLPSIFSSEQGLEANEGGSSGGLFSGTSGGVSTEGLFSGKPSVGRLSSGSGAGGSLLSGGGTGSLFSGSGSLGGLFSRNSAPFSRNPPVRVNNGSLLGSRVSTPKSPTAKPKSASKLAKKGKKIQKVELRSNATKKKEKVGVSSVKKEKKKTSKTEYLKKQKKTEQKKGMIEAVRIKGKKKTKEEKVWVVLPSSAEDDDGEKKKVRGRSLKKSIKTKESKSRQSQKGKRKADPSKDEGSRSRSKSKSVTRKK